MPASKTKLYDRKGRRKYLTPSERERFLAAAGSLPVERMLFCAVLFETGCRISEALQLTVDRIDLGEGVLVFKTLKRRDPEAQRSVLIPTPLLEDLGVITKGKKGRIWTFPRRTAWRIVKSVMEEAKIEGAQACPKGLRHGFAIACIRKNIPIKTIADWMGHADEKTTMIYLDAVGDEEREFASRVWLYTKRATRG